MKKFIAALIMTIAMVSAAFAEYKTWTSKDGHVTIQTVINWDEDKQDVINSLKNYVTDQENNGFRTIIYSDNDTKDFGKHKSDKDYVNKWEYGLLMSADDSDIVKLVNWAREYGFAKYEYVSSLEVIQFIVFKDGSYIWAYIYN